MSKENYIAQLKYKISQVKREMSNESDKRKKQRLNQYKQKLEIVLRDITFYKNGGSYINV